MVAGRGRRLPVLCRDGNLSGTGRLGIQAPATGGMVAAGAIVRRVDRCGRLAQKLDFYRFPVARRRLHAGAAQSAGWICAAARGARSVIDHCPFRRPVAALARWHRLYSARYGGWLRAAAGAMDDAGRRAGSRGADPGQHPAGNEIPTGGFPSYAQSLPATGRRKSGATDAASRNGGSGLSSTSCHPIM